VYATRDDALPASLPPWIASKLREPAALVAVPRHAPRAGRQKDTAYAMAAPREETRRVAAAGNGPATTPLT
jgi:hypothetical protein